MALIKTMTQDAPSFRVIVPVVAAVLQAPAAKPSELDLERKKSQNKFLSFYIRLLSHKSMNLTGALLELGEIVEGRYEDGNT